jgi:Flp pilus assembly protein TadG
VLLEFMMIAPLFLFLCLFAIDMGRLIVVSGAMSDSAYVAARSGAQRGDALVDDNAERAFRRSLEAVPLLGNATSPAEFSVIQPRCTSANSYIVVEASQEVPLITPGLGQLLGVFQRDAGPEALSDTAWDVRSRGSVLCEIVRSP